MKEPREYETTFIMKPDLEEEDIEKVLERIKNVIVGNDGKITDVDVWGKKNLEYEIKDYRAGFYTVIDFTGSTEVVNELDRNLKIIEDIIRHLIVRKED